MKSFAIIAALAGAVMAAPQAVTSAIAPAASAPSGCSTSYSGEFEILVEAIGSTASKRDLQKRTNLEVTLKNGVLTDAEGRTGYIASNEQFQFDGPAQAGAIYTAGWSVCQNGSIALGGSAIFYQCLSGTFYNLYDEDTAAQCSAVYLVAIGSGSTTAAASVSADGQVTAGKAQTVLCQISDGQIQQNTCVTTATALVASSNVVSAAVATITQIGDGQIQAPTTSATPSVATAKATTTPAVAVGTTASASAKASSNGTSLATTSRTPSASSATGTAAASTTKPAASTGGASALAVSSGLFALVGAIAMFAL